MLAYTQLLFCADECLLGVNTSVTRKHCRALSFCSHRMMSWLQPRLLWACSCRENFFRGETVATFEAE